MKPTRVVAVAAHPVSLTAVSAVAALAFHRRGGVVARMLLAVPLGWGASKLLKHLYPKPKPRLLSSSPQQSFPSGHATATAAFTAALVDGFAAWRAAPLALVAIAGVDAARVHAREHRVSEVLAGNAIGLAAAVAAGLLARRLDVVRERLRGERLRHGAAQYGDADVVTSRRAADQVRDAGAVEALH